VLGIGPADEVLQRLVALGQPVEERPTLPFSG
jgi:hypothetical protein